MLRFTQLVNITHVLNVYYCCNLIKLKIFCVSPCGEQCCASQQFCLFRFLSSTDFTDCPLRVDGRTSVAVKTQMPLYPIYLFHSKTRFSIQAIEKTYKFHLLLQIFLLLLPNYFYGLGFQSAGSVTSTLPIYFFADTKPLYPLVVYHLH